MDENFSVVHFVLFLQRAQKCAWLSLTYTETQLLADMIMSGYLPSPGR